MMNVLTIAAGVVLGSLVTSGLGLCLMLNKKILKKFTQHYLKVITEVSNEVIREELLEEESD